MESLQYRHCENRFAIRGSMETQNALISSLRDSAKLQKWRSILVIARLDEIKSWQSKFF